MKRIKMMRGICFLFALSLLCLSACTATTVPAGPPTGENADGNVAAADAGPALQTDAEQKNGTPKEEPALQMMIDDTAVAVDWEDNDAVAALSALTEQGAVTVAMTKYGGFEQVGALGKSLPRNDVSITTEAGDLVLYNGNQIVVFYGSNTWSYTRLGKIRGMDRAALEALLGNDAVTLTLSVG